MSIEFSNSRSGTWGLAPYLRVSIWITSIRYNVRRYIL